MLPKALILHATGTNRDHDAARALDLAGAQPEIVPLLHLRAGSRRWRDYQMLVLPGGFAYADALGAGKLLALDLNLYFADAVNDFVAAGKPVLGICNGFQALVKAGLLPSPDGTPERDPGRATLTFNAKGHFECRWVTLRAASQKCIWTRGMNETIYCPIAHGEGNFQLADSRDLERLRARDQIALRYARGDGAAAAGAYPLNPNGSLDDIAGVCNPQGNVLGLMPHPEDHIFNYQHPRHTRGECGQSGLPLFVNGVQYAAQI
ncbi:MAG: phosphoribosylformylglycinamidine synthase I [Anaerolineae bacterium]|nr:phosphoribosylformylglycinamidine synthase I [Anaerolineae bacterium]